LTIIWIRFQPKEEFTETEKITHLLPWIQILKKLLNRICWVSMVEIMILTALLKTCDRINMVSDLITQKLLPNVTYHYQATIIFREITMLNQALKTLIKQIKFMRGPMPFKTVTYIITIQAQWELIEIVTTCHQVKLWVKPIELRTIQIWTNTIQDWEPTIMNIEAKDTSKLLTSRNRKNICKMPVLKSWLQENLKNFSHLWLINEMEVIIIANRSCHLSIKIECLQW
jgi:hypothetical protein